MCSLIYKASPKYIVMITSKSPKAMSTKAQTERKVDLAKKHKHPRLMRSLNSLKLEQRTF